MCKIHSFQNYVIAVLCFFAFKIVLGRDLVLGVYLVFKSICVDTLQLSLQVAAQQEAIQRQLALERELSGGPPGSMMLH